MYLQPSAHGLVCGFEKTLTYADFDPYQKWMSRLLQTKPAVYLGAFMGAGKTAVALHAFCCLWEKNKSRKALIVCPLNVARDTWPTEILSWDFSRQLRYAVVVGTENERLAALRTEADIYVVNRENLKWLIVERGLSWFSQFEVLIYDEASRLKSGAKLTAKPRDPKKQRTKTEFAYVCDVRLRVKRVWALSGTPSSNGVIDLWGPFYVLDGGERLGKTRTAFRDRWFDYDAYKRTWKPKGHASREIMRAVADIMFVLREEDYITLPRLKVIDREVSLSEKHMQLYRKFKRELYLEELDVEAATKAVLVNKLLQFANGSVYAPEDDESLTGGVLRKPKAKHVHDRKLDALASLFEEAGGRPLLVAYSYQFDVVAIKKRFPWVRVYGETRNDLADWNAGKLRALVLHPASAGHGMNFQHGGSIAVWYGLCWSLELYQQFNKRLHRRGQQAGCVQIYRILARDTHDTRVAQALESKGVTQDEIVERVRVYPREIEA